ncbi:MAG: RT0821/Lpp0805 family surface protein [Pseudomonadota bacterium]|jgi:surface antigen|nr:RT0821/Lpp0805 family surface protein [Pseudomonadota bacterium]
MKKIVSVFSILGILALGACENSNFNKEQFGTVSGAVLGGLAGSQVGSGSGRLWAVGAGTLLGAFLGSEVGKSLDKADLVYAERAAEKAHQAPMGETISWNNPETGNAGDITPVKDGYASESGRYCREYKQTIYIDGQAETAFGTACQNKDGTWQII